jgi:hypothetical protein
MLGSIAVELTCHVLDSECGVFHDTLKSRYNSDFISLGRCAARLNGLREVMPPFCLGAQPPDSSWQGCLEGSAPPVFRIIIEGESPRRRINKSVQQASENFR